MGNPTKTIHAPTAIVWGIVTENELPLFPIKTYLTLVNTLYPGIDYFAGSFDADLSTILDTYARPDLARQYPKLEKYKTAAEAVKALGETFEVGPVRECNGYEWQDNPCWGISPDSPLASKYAKLPPKQPKP